MSYLHNPRISGALVSSVRQSCHYSRVDGAKKVHLLSNQGHPGLPQRGTLEWLHQGILGSRLKYDWGRV